MTWGQILLIVGLIAYPIGLYCALCLARMARDDD